MTETLGQRIFRAIIASIAGLLAFAATMYYGYTHYPIVQQYWFLPTTIMVGYVLYKDIQIIRGKD